MKELHCFVEEMKNRQSLDHSKTDKERNKLRDNLTAQHLKLDKEMKDKFTKVNTRIEDEFNNQTEKFGHTVSAINEKIESIQTWKSFMEVSGATKAELDKKAGTLNAKMDKQFKNIDDTFIDKVETSMEIVGVLGKGDECEYQKLSEWLLVSHKHLTKVYDSMYDEFGTNRLDTIEGTASAMKLVVEEVKKAMTEQEATIGEQLKEIIDSNIKFKDQLGTKMK